MNILGIIPARGGSKGIPLKNIKKICGTPLIEFTINSAIKSKKVNRIIVSTDNKKIAKISQSLGAEVPFLRPKNISADSSSTIDVVKHAIKKLQKDDYVPDIITILQPTSPFRTYEMIDSSIELLKKSKATSVISVEKIKKHPFSSFWLYDQNLKHFRKDFSKFHQRQLLPKLFSPTGAIYTLWLSTLMKYDSLYGSRIKPMIIDNEIINLDIDNDFDIFIAEMYKKYWKNQKSFKMKFKH